jgi:hypothetical protein
MNTVNGIKTGDLLLVAGNKWLSKKIRQVTKSKYNHIGMFYWCYGELMVIEMDRTNRGLFKLKAEIKMTPFSEYLKHDYKLLIRKPTFNVSGNELGAEMIRDIGVRKFDYSYFDLLVSQTVFQFTGKWIGRKKIDNTLICSQYVAWRLNMSYELYPDWYKLAPSDFVFDKNFYDYCLVSDSYINYYN